MANESLDFDSFMKREMMPKNLRNINPALLSLQNSQVFKSEDEKNMNMSKE